MTRMTFFAAGILAVLSSVPAFAQDAHMNHMAAPKTTAADTTAASPSTKAFEAANAKMHKDMAVTYTGNADVDFVRSMIPHHQGAIDMAKIELEHGKDPEIRKLAQEVIRAQEAEIAMMKAWLAKHDK